MLKVSKLILCSFLLTACKTTPGLDEPVISKCRVFPESLECINSATGELVIYPPEEALGMNCVFPRDEAKIENHHDALHLELNECQKKCR